MSISKIKQAIIDAVNSNKDQIIDKIVNQKRIMFDDNSHAWIPLLPQTISRKNREKDLFRTPENINIRKGGLFKAVTNEGSYKAAKGNEQINFDIELDNFEQIKANIVAFHGRDVVDVIQTELNQISDDITEIITANLQQKYGKQ